MKWAMARRFALVAAVVLLAPVWVRAVSGGDTPDRGDGLFVGVAIGSSAPAPAIRRQAEPGSWDQGSFGGQSHGPATAALAALLALLLGARRATFAAVPAASPLTQRRHVIALRGPPRPLLP